jgi:regulator of RNase E activity RraA
VTALHIHDVHRIALARADLLAGFRSPDVANALGDGAELCGPELRPVWSSPPVVGVALTVQLAAGDNLSHSYDDRDPTLNQQTFLLKYAYTFDLSR